MINRLSIEDIEHLIRIEKENFDNPWTKKQFIRCYDHPLYFLSYVYCKSSKVIAYIVSEVIIDEIHLHKISVEKKYQNNKVGLKLVEYMIMYSKMLSKVKICLEVNSSNIAALKLYNNLGFIAVGKRENYYESSDAILMDLDLKNA